MILCETNTQLWGREVKSREIWAHTENPDLWPWDNESDSNTSISNANTNMFVPKATWTTTSTALWGSVWRPLTYIILLLFHCNFKWAPVLGQRGHLGVITWLFQPHPPSQAFCHLHAFDSLISILCGGLWKATFTSLRLLVFGGFVFYPPSRAAASMGSFHSICFS